AMDLENRPFAQLLGLQNRGADSSAPGELGRNEALLLRQSERLPNGARHARILRYCANQGHRSGYPPASYNRALIISRYRVTQAPQDLRGSVPLLLRVDHVAFGEHRTTAGDSRAALGRAHEIA